MTQKKSGEERQWRKPTSVGVSIASGLKFENITYNIGNKTIVDDVSLDVVPGEVLCLLGPSGSGKTSLLKIAAGLIEQVQGQVIIDSRVVVSADKFVPPEKRGIGLVFQDYALFPHLTIRQNVEFGLTALKRTDATDQAIRILARVGLEERAEQYPHILSGGEQQRVALARALAPRPSILLMDEPFSGLDSRLRDSIRGQTIDLLRETRSTAIIVTHDAEEALRVGDRIALIKDGGLVQHGNAEEIYFNPVNLYAAGFFSEINTIPVDMNGKTAETIFGSKNLLSGTAIQQIAAVRYTDISVQPQNKTQKGVLGTILTRRFLGTSELLEVSVQSMEKPVFVRVKPGQLAPDITIVQLEVDPEVIMIFPDLAI